MSVVTGGGKTTFAYLCALDFVAENDNPRIIVVVPTLALLDQWYIGLRDDLGVTEEEIGLFSGRNSTGEPRVWNLIVLNTARHIISSVAQGANAFLIVDECHRAAAPANAQALRGEFAAVLGLSATPDRQYDSGLAEYLIPALGRVIYTYDYRAAHQDGILSPFELVNVRVNLLPDEDWAYRNLSRRVALERRRVVKGVSDGAALKRLLQRRSRVASGAAMRVPVAARLVDEHRGSRTVLFSESVEIASKILKILLARRHSATIYHSKIADPVRRDNLRLFRNGVYDVLVSCRALDEGLNVPEAEVAIIASATASRRQRIQRLGRVLRPAPDKEGALIYTLYATDQEERRLLREAKQLEGVASVQWNHARRGRDGTASGWG